MCLKNKINSEFCLFPPNKDFMSFVCCFEEEKKKPKQNLEPPMLKPCIFNSPRRSKTNCQRQASIYRCTNCLQSRVYLFYWQQSWRLQSGRQAGGVLTIISKSKHERLSTQLRWLASIVVRFDLSLPRTKPWAVDLRSFFQGIAKCNVPFTWFNKTVPNVFPALMIASLFFKEWVSEQNSVLAKK